MKNAIVFGTGKNTLQAIEEGAINLDNVQCFVTSQQHDNNAEFLNRPLVSLDTLSNQHLSSPVIIVSDSYGQIVELFLAKGYSIENLYAYIRLKFAEPQIVKLAKCAKPKYLNIGGGYFFHFDNWINLEGAASYLYPFALGAHCDFPVDSNSLELVYSSHCFEHLGESTVQRMLLESHRCLQDNGQLLIKIPDFDTIFRELKGNEVADSILTGDYWSFPKLVKAWHKMQVEDNVVNRALCVLCSIEMREVSQMFEKSDGLGEEYIGPVPLKPAEYDALLSLDSPAKMTRYMVAKARDEFKHAQLIHQSSWSSDEFIALAKQFGFAIESVSREQINRDFHWVPQIKKVDMLSAYYLFRKVQ